MAQQIYMDVPKVREMAQKYNHFVDLLQTTKKALDSAMSRLGKSHVSNPGGGGMSVNAAVSALNSGSDLPAWAGSSANAGYHQYIEQITPLIESYIQKCQEMSEDLLASARAFERSDELGSTKFH